MRDGRHGLGGQHPRELLRPERDALLLILVEGAGDPLRAAQHLVDRLAEPARRAVAQNLAAADEHEHRGNDAHRQERADQLGAEARERRRAPVLDHNFSRFGQHEHQRHQQRQVHRQQRVEQHVGQELRLDLRRPARQPEQAGHHRDQQRGQCREHARVVEQPAPREGGGRRRAHRRSPEHDAIT
jgi:hypothetical protein